MKIRFLAIAFLCKIASTFCQHPAICFIQTVKSFRIAEPILYSEFDALMLSPIDSAIPIRCICPKSQDNRSLELQPHEGVVADPKICLNRVRAVMDYMSLSPTEVQTFYIGFEIWEPSLKKNHFLPVIEIAFNKSLRTPVYVKYRYRSPNLNYFVFWASQNYQPIPEYEKNPTLFGGHDLQMLYSAESQQEIFSQFLDDPYYEELFHTNQPILVQQQLANHNDFLLETWKEVTYFDVNTAPMFRVVQWTWQKIETFVVSVSKALQRHLYITTGVSMVKEFIGLTGNIVQIYLNQKTTPHSTPVPEIFWKILLYTNVHDNDDNKYGLLVIMHNDPLYLSNEPLCNKIPAGKQWDELFSNEQDQVSKKIAYTCELNEANLRKLRLPVSLPIVENFLNVEEVQKRFDTDNADRRPVFRFT